VTTIACPFRTAVLSVLFTAAIAVPAFAEDKKEEPTLSEIVNILHDKGLIDDAEHEALSAKAAKEQTKHSWIDRISLFGDLRGRFEMFDYKQDIYSKSAGKHLNERYRARYRARLGVNAKVASRASVTVAMNTNGADPRSGNQTLGSGNDFDKDEFRLDLAYATISPFADGVLPGVDNGYLAADLGKVKNPFIWKQLGVDNLLFDNDINFEGGNLRLTGNAGPVALFANGGVYVIDENNQAGSTSAAKDPLLSGGQLGASVKLAKPVSIGGRATLYNFSSLDDDFFARAASNPDPPNPGGTGGNIIDGLSRRNGSIQIVETAGFLELRFIDLVPLLIYGSYANNLSAHPSRISNADSEDDAWTFGIFAGDKVRLLRIGAAYYYVEANAFPSMYLESDVLDGTPNRQGYMGSVERQLFENVDLALRGFWSRRIEGGIAFSNSGQKSDRFRGQADVTFKF
jgi:hypothetical protein